MTVFGRIGIYKMLVGLVLNEKGRAYIRGNDNLRKPEGGHIVPKILVTIEFQQGLIILL